MKQISRNVFLVFTLSIFALSPIFTFADNDDDKFEKRKEKIENRLEKQVEKAEKRAEKQKEKLEKRIEKFENKQSDLCWRRYLLPFWIKTNWDNIDLNTGCPLPKATSTPDNIPPVISNISSKTGNIVALVIWNTNEKSTGKIYYSTSSPVNIGTAQKVSAFDYNFGGNNHYALIFNLSSHTNYYAVVEAKDKAGNISRSSEFSFTTMGTTSAPDTLPPSISNISATTSTSTLSVSWNTNENATSKVYYATSTPINLSLADFYQSGTLLTNHNLTLSNLSTSTTYYLVVESKDAAGNQATSSEFSKTTSAP